MTKTSKPMPFKCPTCGPSTAHKLLRKTAKGNFAERMVCKKCKCLLSITVSPEMGIVILLTSCAEVKRAEKAGLLKCQKGW